MDPFIPIHEIAKLASRSSSQGGEHGTQRRFERIDNTPQHVCTADYGAHENVARGADLAYATSPEPPNRVFADTRSPQTISSQVLLDLTEGV
jgi:hypothetical protein